MASAQCNKNKPSNEITCPQKGRSSGSLGQKVSNWVKGNHQGQQQPKPICQTQAQAEAEAEAQPCPNKVLAHKPQRQCGGAKASGGTRHSHTHCHAKHQPAACGAACQCMKNPSSTCHGSCGHNNAATSCATSCQGKATVALGEIVCEQKKERNLLKRIKDRISGNNSSSSDSESDKECCHKKN